VSAERSDQWSTGDAYEAFMGRWSRAVARRFVHWLGHEPGLAWLDVGCGTGALTAAICDGAEPLSVIACDPSEAFVSHARSEIVDARVTVVVAGAVDLPRDPEGFDRVVSGLVLNFIPDPARAVEAMRARLCPGGLVAAYVWDYAEGMAFLRTFWDEAARLDPAAQSLDEGARFPLSTRPALEALFEGARLDDVRSEAIDIPTRFESFADYWRPFLGGTGPAPAYVASLAEPQREALRARLEQHLGGSPIELTARAWAIRGDVGTVTPG
jgi:SAM-dependent methyltransferase